MTAMLWYADVREITRVITHVVRDTSTSELTTGCLIAKGVIGVCHVGYHNFSWGHADLTQVTSCVLQPALGDRRGWRGRSESKLRLA